MELIPIHARLEDNAEFINNPLCRDTLEMTITFFNGVGYMPPWIGYYVKEDGELVGSAAFKGPPVKGSVEIAYGTVEQFRQKGIGKKICRELVKLALRSDPDVRITARTLPDKNFSTRILESNGFYLLGIVNDQDDGEVWEWEFRKGQLIQTAT